MFYDLIHSKLAKSFEFWITSQTSWVETDSW